MKLMIFLLLGVEIGRAVSWYLDRSPGNNGNSSGGDGKELSDLGRLWTLWSVIRSMVQWYWKLQTFLNKVNQLRAVAASMSLPSSTSANSALLPMLPPDNAFQVYIDLDI